MSPKMHIFIVAGIIFVMFLVWQVISLQGTPVAKGPSPYAIEINQASYGANCPRQQPTDSFQSPTMAPSLENNVLKYMSDLCNGKPSCAVLVGPSAFGDPVPGCLTKELRVEYRCFSVDRPWRKSSKDSNTLEINCDENR